MELVTRSILSSISITDRNGKRVGAYLIDKSKDALNGEQRRDKKRGFERERAPQAEAYVADEAVVFHSSTSNSGEARGDAGSLEIQMGLSSKLDISV
jgi:hypothetical protein